MLIALAFPPLGIDSFPLAALLIQIPEIIIGQGEKWQGFVLFLPVLFIFFSCVIYGMASLALALYEATLTNKLV